ncbi:MAG: AgmX/PglI C-terminal domain-containing protein [Deltaproteobacteria bacterium]|nr:AgmX/PglI C-terminal domain-containing protein [Deltaproteobacteria bacterium]
MAQKQQAVRQQVQPGTAQPQPAGKSKILRIGIILGGKIVEERLIRDRVTVSIGQSAKNTFSMPFPELPKMWPLFDLLDGKYVLNIAEGMDGRLSDGGHPIPLAQARTNGQAKKVGVGWQLSLSENARGKIICGDMTLLFQFVTAPPLQPKPQLPHSVRGRLADRIDPYMAVVLVLSFLVHGGSVVAIYNMDMPALPSPDEIPDRFAKSIMQKPPTLEPKEKDTKAASTVADEKPEETYKGVQGKGDDKPKKGKGDDKPPAPVEEAPPVEAAVAQQVQNQALFKVLGARSSSGSGRFADVLGGKDSGEDLDKGLANVGKSGTAVALPGAGSGPGIRGSATGTIGAGKSTGVTGPTGTGNVGGAKGEDEIRADVRSGGLDEIESGGLDPAKVMATIKARYFSGVQQCYQRALKANPKLGGKVSVGFSIGAAGNVTKVTVDGFDGEVDSCIEAQARRWRFDKPEEGSAEFEIPFILRPGN